MLELSALGLLQLQPLHGYRLKQQLELFMSSCISVNYGAIYPLLKRLEERGDISVIAEEAGDAGCPRKIYGITAQGRELWRQKMLEHPQESWVNSGSRFQIKFFFFGELRTGRTDEIVGTPLASLLHPARLHRKPQERISTNRRLSIRLSRSLQVSAGVRDRLVNRATSQRKKRDLPSA
jgi:DNA-binding PadR family transcriptional regulator